MAPPLPELAGLWSPAVPYLDTASYGLPPRPALEALEAALEEWRTGRGRWERWQEAADRARAAFARLVGAEAEHVAIGATVSGLLGLVAASLPDGARVVVPDVEFASNLFPWLVQQGRGVEVRAVPLAGLAAAVDRGTTLVAVSAVQSSTGQVAELDAVVEAARAAGALVALDATQACGWLPLDASRFDFLACHAYKWLMSPRGTAFLAVRPGLIEELTPHAAGWAAGEDVHASYYGPPLRLARSARRLDTSPAWFSWLGAVPALELVERIGVERIHVHDVGLAERLRAGLGLEAAGSAIVAVEQADAPVRLERAGIRAAIRAGGARLSFHVYNTEADVDSALEALTA